MKMRNLVIIVILSSVGLGFSQETGSVYFSSELLPSSDVGTVAKNSIGFEIPIKNRNKKESISVIGEYQNSNINFVDADVPFETDQIENFHTFTLGLLYNRILKNGWGYTFKVAPQISSNYDEQEFDSNDILINGSVVFDKLNEEKQTMWSFGAEYDTQNGLNFPIPVIAYTKRLNEKLAYKIGFPDSRAKWTLNNNNNIEAFTTLDGLSSNINDDIDIYKEDYTGTLKHTYLVGGLGYNLTFLKNFELNAKAGYSGFNTMKVQDYDNNEIYDFDIKNSLYFNLGVKFNLNQITKVKSPY